MQNFGLAAFLLFLSSSCLAQAFVLPNTQTIIDSGIASIEVIINEQPTLDGWQSADSDTTADDSSTQRPYFTFYFNTFGRIDSHLYSLDLPGRLGVRLKYDSLGRIIELNESMNHRPQFKRQKIWPNDDGWIFREWEDGTVIRTTFLNRDSVILNDSLLSGGITSLYHYDPETEEFTTEHFKDNELCARTYQHWILKNGLPDSLLLVSEFHNAELPRHMNLEKKGVYTAKHKVLATGEVVSLPETSFTSTARNLTFAQRLNRSRGITLYHEQRMLADHLADRGPTAYIQSFDGLTNRSYISYTYHYR